MHVRRPQMTRCFYLYQLATSMTSTKRHSNNLSFDHLVNPLLAAIGPFLHRGLLPAAIGQFLHSQTTVTMQRVAVKMPWNDLVYIWEDYRLKIKSKHYARGYGN